MNIEAIKNTLNKGGKGKFFYGITAAVIICAAFLFFYLHYKATHITTDDAFVEGKIHTIASKVGGTVRAIHVKDNQFVKKDELLVEIDEADYDVRVKEASSALDAEKARFIENQHKLDTVKKQLLEIMAAIGAAKANVELQAANLQQAKSDMKRAENLFKQEAISKEKYEKTNTVLETHEAQLKASREHVKQLEASLEAQHSIIKQVETTLATQRAMINYKQAVLDGALLNRGYTKILAPVDGYVTKKSVEVGNQISTGFPLLAVVALDDIWIVANYKETQVEKIKPGQKARIKVDTYSGVTLTGAVDSIMAGTGVSFSLFPPENATGNYVKVVQRIPIKIILDRDTDRKHILRIGMSVVPTVITR